MKMSHGGRQKFLGRSQSQLEELWPADITINGESYKAACVGERTEESLAIGGYAEDVDLVIRLSKTIHPTKPADGTTLTYNGKKRRIIRVPDLLEPAWMIQCEHLDGKRS